MKAWLKIVWVFVLIAAWSMADCARLTKRRQASSMENCLAEFKAMPEVDGILQSRASAEQGSEDPQPFSGMEIALTLNGAIRSTADPDADVDDLCYKQNNVENLRKLIDTLKQNDMPPTVDFVSAKNIDPEMAELWLDSGNLLGNLTYDNRRVIQLGAEDFVADISEADEQLAAIWRKHGQTMKYFRYPAFKRARDDSSRETVERYLSKAGYITVPCTIESMDDRFADIYCKALEEGDKSCASVVKVNYYPVLMDTTLRARSVARELAGRELRQILVLYLNQLTFDTLDQTLAWYRRLGARFISLDQALADPFFKAAPGGGDPTGRTIVRAVRDEQMSLGK
jgi:peptidoglycan/xylan/chitin deacetylase (PgdA/CDA1 family)